MENTKKSGLAVTSLVLGIIAIATSFLPVVNNGSIVLGIIAVIFGLIPLFKKKSKGKAVAGIIFGVLAVVFSFALQDMWGESLDEMSGDATDKILKNDLDVDIGEFTIIADEYGISEAYLTVIVTNKSDETNSFDITIGATNENGERIDEDYISISELKPGEKSKEYVFEYIFSEDEAEIMKNATFKVIKASKY